MQEQQQLTQQQSTLPRSWRLTGILAGGSSLGVAILLLFSHADLFTTAFFCIVVTFASGWQGQAIIELMLPQAVMKSLLAFLSQKEIEGKRAPKAQKLDVPEYSDEDEEEYEDEQQRDWPESCFTFSQVLRDFNPSLRLIYLGTLPDGSAIYSDARGLCHVALAGATGGGKSSIIRLLMSQLCKAGASVLLLNPHYTHFDLDEEEDWTPFEPYLVHDPMECRKDKMIEHYLHQVAMVLLPKRLEKYAHSQPTGKPYFLVVDELPLIVENIPDAPTYLAKILREGRKVGIFLITASQDFLVKTISPQGGGAIRDCYRTAFYVGGDPTTARVLLDVPANQIQEDTLGKGTVMLRSQNVKQARVIDVPYVDNQALYKLLGPSTYTGYDEDDEDDMFLENLHLQQDTETPKPMPVEHPSPTNHVTLSPQLQRVYDVFQSGMSDRALGRVLGAHHATAGKYIQLLINKGLIDENRQKKTG